MVFKAGQSGNPVGRAKGSVNRRTQLAKLLEPHAETLVTKMVELALSGDTNALRLCIERLIPKAQKEPTYIDLPRKLTQKNLSILKLEILVSATNGTMAIGDAEKLTNLIDSQLNQNNDLISTITLPTDAVEASKIYKQIMGQ
jgi:hypothetical protein